MTRYQDCAWPVRLWRRRWYLTVPFRWAAMVVMSRVDPPRGAAPIRASQAWSLALAIAQVKMGWTYTLDEGMDRLRGRLL